MRYCSPVLCLHMNFPTFTVGYKTISSSNLSTRDMLEHSVSSLMGYTQPLGATLLTYHIYITVHDLLSIVVELIHSLGMTLVV